MTENPERLPRIVLSTAGSQEEAARISRELVERGLAACVNRVPGVSSIYRWKGAIEEAAEVLMIIKTTEDRLPGLQGLLQELHSYEIPEFIVLTAASPLRKYLDWLSEV
jgi:periplasmic divalent cation tolerance protein